jgi:hypothetical protein
LSRRARIRWVSGSLSIVAEERSLRVYGSETLMARPSALGVRMVQFFPGDADGLLIKVVVKIVSL